MLKGLFAGLFWALDTIILGVALIRPEFTNTVNLIFLAPFISTFLHDLISSIWLFLYLLKTHELKHFKQLLHTRSARFIMLGALLGGPIGMSGYVYAIRYLGPAYTAMLSALFPALGALLSYLFLKEKMSKLQLLGLCFSIFGIILLGYESQQMIITNFKLGLFCAIICCFGWASEAVICAYGMKETEISNRQALMIRQPISTLFYGLFILTTLNAWSNTISIFTTPSVYIILCAALFGTASYLCYYKAINLLGASKAMMLNITYSAWAIIFSFLFFHSLPNLKSIIAGIFIVCGSLIAANIINLKH